MAHDATLDTVDLFARNVADVAVFAEALSGRALALDGTQRGTS
jgi:Asp-tRNA(Asn)/Glu-tRNA(Gln) amidotransferase A subunit family amidase